MNQAALGRIVYQQQEQILLNQVQALFLGLVQSILVFSIPQRVLSNHRGETLVTQMLKLQCANRDTITSKFPQKLLIGLESIK